MGTDEDKNVIIAIIVFTPFTKDALRFSVLCCKSVQKMVTHKVKCNIVVDSLFFMIIAVSQNECVHYFLI